MKDEEKKAIDELIARREYFEYNKEGCNHHLSFDEWETEEIIDTILNLIEKQQKEIEELKRKEQLIKTYKGNLPENVEFICLCKKDFERNISDDYISKDKIEEILKKIENTYEDISEVVKDLNLLLEKE